MSVIWNIILITSVFLVNNSIICVLSNSEEIGKQNGAASESPEGHFDKGLENASSTTEMDEINEEVDELTVAPTQKETEEEENAKEGPDKTEETDAENLKNFLALFDQIESETTDIEEEEVKKSPEEMREMKAKVFKLINELNEKQGLSEISPEEFDKIWNRKKEEYGKTFPRRIEKLIPLLKTNEEKEEPTSPDNVISEIATDASAFPSDISKEEEPPKDAFVLRNAKGKICILAKFQSVITITYSGKTSEQKVEVTIPPNGNTKGKCGGSNRSPSLQIFWGKFLFGLMFNKTSEDSWGATSVELTYDKSEPLFDEALDRNKITAKSKKVNLFETPFGKSYFCPGHEIILLYSENQHVATVRLKEVHLQAYDIEDGKFSPSHRCSQVVIGGPDEEPFVQDETIPLAVGCTLALITLMILVGFSVHRAYHAAKVDYNSME